VFERRLKAMRADKKPSHERNAAKTKASLTEALEVLPRASQ
jgi:hypothetical protein